MIIIVRGENECALCGGNYEPWPLTWWGKLTSIRLKITLEITKSNSFPQRSHTTISDETLTSHVPHCMTIRPPDTAPISFPFAERHYAQGGVDLQLKRNMRWRNEKKQLKQLTSFMNSSNIHFSTWDPGPLKRTSRKRGWRAPLGPAGLACSRLQYREYCRRLDLLGKVKGAMIFRNWLLEMQ